MNAKAAVKIIFVTAIVLFISAYTYYQAQDLIQGPRITIFYPLNGSLANESLTEIRGEVHNITHINLNNRPIFIDENGIFSEKVMLAEGYNTITVSAQDKFGRYKEEVIAVMLKETKVVRDNSPETTVSLIDTKNVTY